MPRVLVIGASRGIGFELVKQYLADGWSVHATTRTTDEPGALGSLDGDLSIHEMEVRNQDHVARLVEDLGGMSLDVAIHNAGIYRGKRHDIMAINAEAPIRVVEALLPNVSSGKVVLISSGLGARRGRTGSLGDYGDSKAALNDALRERADAWREAGVLAIVVNPGWVRTDMGGSSAPVAVTDSAAGIRKLVAEMGPDHHGGFYDYQGDEHPW